MAGVNTFKVTNGFLRNTLSVQPYSTIYAATSTIATTTTSGTAITLPSSQTYSGAELMVYLNNAGPLIVGTDYNYVGSGSRTQISFTTNLYNGDVIQFVILRSV